MASLLFERNRVTQLEKDLQNKDQALKSLMMGGEPGSSRRDSRESSRLRHDSASSEVGRILGSPDTDLVLQNERFPAQRRELLRKIMFFVTNRKL